MAQSFVAHAVCLIAFCASKQQELQMNRAIILSETSLPILYLCGKEVAQTILCSCGKEVATPCEKKQEPTLVQEQLFITVKHCNI